MYQVCPFKKVTQAHFPNRDFNLGKVAEWVHKKNGRYVLRMDEGDSHLCPDGLFRMSLVSKDVYTVTPVLRDHPFCNQNTVFPLL